MQFDIRDHDRYGYRNTILESMDPMETVTLSPKFQVVIPKEIRDRLELSPGQKIQAIAYGDRIELIPVRPLGQMRGFLKGIDTDVEREPDRT